jgi:membrane peptidoglycan carboxypeptidase
MIKTLLPFLKKLFSFFFKIFSALFKVGLVLGFLGAFVLLTGAYFVWHKEKDRVKTSLDRFKSEVTNHYDASVTKPVRIYDKNKKLIGEFNRKNFRPIRTDNLKEHSNMVWALLSSEDRVFYKHSGINYAALIRAFVVNLSQLKLSQGGSTITQQLAKLSLNLGERNVFNKITEAFCAYYIENQYDKDTILAMYMNQIFLGEGNVGLEEAARYYFNKSAAKLTPAEAALLTGIIPAPSVYNPVKNLKISLARQKRILFDMANNKSLHYFPDKIEKNFENKIEESIRKFKSTYKVKEIKTADATKYTSEIGKNGFDRDFKINLAPDFNDSIRKFILEKFPGNELERKSLNVYTSLDYTKQEIAQISIQEGVDEIRKNLEKNRAKYLAANKIEEAKREKEIIDGMNASLVSINPQNGHVEALVGAYKISRVYRLNRAEEAKRQPGSSIKGLIYALALEKRIITPSSIVVDEKLTGYSPKNWYAGFKGAMTARQALAQSVNTVSVKLLREMGVNYFLNKLALILNIPISELSERLGDRKNLSLALGSGELTPMELATIYATLANGGYRVIPKKILRITDEEGLDLLPPEEEQERIQIIDSVACAMVINMMEAVLTAEGTMNIKLKNDKRFPMAGKSGTVQSPKEVFKKWGGRKGVRDTWFAGIFPGLATAIWIGNDQGAPFPGSGSGNSGQVWLKYGIYLKSRIGFGDHLIEPFDGDFVRVDICGETGELLEDVPKCKYPLYNQYYYRGDEPQKINNPPPITDLNVNPIDFHSGDQNGVDLGSDSREPDPPELLIYSDESEQQNDAPQQDPPNENQTPVVPEG